MEGLFHIFSDGSKSADLFIGEKEFKDAVNRLAISAYISGVKTIAFSLQDTHVHLLAYGELDGIINFIHQFKKRTNDYLTRFRHRNTGLSFSFLEVTDDDYAKNVASYVICQATKDGKKTLPIDYKWSSAALYFRTEDINANWTKDGKIFNIGSTPHRNIKPLFHCNVKLPGNWQFCNGMILPSSFIDIDRFESIFRTHNCYRVFCGGGSGRDNVIADKMYNCFGANYEEAEAREFAANCCRRLFGHRNIRTLDVRQRIELARIIRKEHHLGYSQLSRRVYLPESEVRRYVK